MRINLLHQFQLDATLQTLVFARKSEEYLAKHTTNQIANGVLLEHRHRLHRDCASKKNQEMTLH